MNRPRGSLGLEASILIFPPGALEKEMATHSSVLAWEISWKRSLEGYSPWGRKESDTTEAT